VSRPSRPVTRFLGAKHLLLVVDNLEHVLGAASFIGRAGRRVPHAHRGRDEPRAARRPGRVRYPVGTLRRRRCRRPVRRWRAHAHDPGFHADEGTAQDVAEICRRVDGLPLAIELAAARCALLSPAEIAERLDAALGAGPRDAPARQRTLRADDRLEPRPARR
jgi:predicted ATPase